MIRRDIEFYDWKDFPIPLNQIEIKIKDSDFSEIFNDKDFEILDNVWKEVIKISSKSFSIPKGLASLVDTTNGYSFQTTQFRDYVAISRTSEGLALSPACYENMRVAGVGAYLEMGDGSIFVHRRSKNATHAAGYIDSSCAGLILLNNGEMNVQNTLREKLQRELKLTENEVKILGLKSVHSSSRPDFSGMLDIGVKTEISPGELESRIKGVQFEEYEFVQRKNLSEFIREHYALKEDMIGDGAATLMGVLNRGELLDLLREIGKSRNIEFGKLVDGQLKN